MNPLTNVKNINKLNETELARGTVDKKSWHDMYKESAWIFIGGLAYGLTEGDILSVFSQYGEIVNINLIRDSKTGKIKGFCFLCYANQKSTVLAVDNFNGIKLCGRTIRVDHVANYKPPKEHENDDEVTKHLKNEGCAPKPIQLESAQSSNEPPVAPRKEKSKKVKKEKKKHKKKRKHEIKQEVCSPKKIKEEKVDPGYSKYEFSAKERSSKRKDKHREVSSDSESSSSSESCDSDSNRNKLSRFRHNVKQSGKEHKERHENHKARDGASDSHKMLHKEMDESSSDSQEESDKRKRIKDRDNFARSSKSKSWQSPDRNRKRNHSKEDRQRDQSESNDHRQRDRSEANDHRQRDRSESNDHRQRDRSESNDHRQRDRSESYDHRQRERSESNDHRKGDYFSEQETFKRRRHSSSESDTHDKPESRYSEKDKERRSKDRNRYKESGKGYDGMIERYESGKRHRKEADYDKSSRRERYH